MAKAKKSPAKSPARKVVKKKSKKINADEELKNLVISGMQEKKAKEIVCIDLRNVKNAVADFFVVCHADSKTHVEAIADAVEDYVKEHSGEYPGHKEGKANAEWILLDYMNVVVHVFRHEQREFYGLERLWADADIQQIASNF
ncbi:MAG: ribosome silencing factor [Bacteroidota bacterium]